MGALAALVRKDGGDVSNELIASISALAHRVDGGFGIASPARVGYARRPEGLPSISSSVGIAFGLARITGRDVPQPILGPGYAYAVDGRVYRPPLSASELSRVIGDRPQRALVDLLRRYDGDLALAVAVDRGILAIRDPLGVAPLYYGESDRLAGLATERKALWGVGIGEVRSFPPGHIAHVRKGIVLNAVRQVSRVRGREVSWEGAARRLTDLLLASVEGRVRDVNRVTVGFSGGIDSSLIALLSSRFVDTELVTVGMGGAEIEHAREAVDLLGLRLIAKVHTVDDLREAIPRVLWLIEEPNLMKLGVAIPFYWASREGAARRRRVMLSGQGSDEMYGGYARYLRIYRDEGPDAVDRAMLSDVVRAYEVNYERDNKACACNKVEVRHPFADWGVVGFSLSLPVGFKIASGEDLLRKRIVRRVGEMVGLPKRIVDRPKRAVQYSSGVDRAIRRVARGMGLRPQEYVLRVFHEVFGFKRPA